ncbi:uncharacterized protein Dwil_GK22653 [Drosophila willistoni]|uniref:Uncharacterized protein n=1 Tax=Drosophila willistoni TaxID=7260 RepID=B4NFJ5_DROWI|nr:uncharacterized protein LOC6649395 [Drosophila willistoni]EDW83062.1 uncharacterized protein Dwil_GK22653 [Drosophila willistoni]
MSQNERNIDLDLNLEILTAATAAEFVNGIFDYLLYQRRQIPFVYKTYKYFIEKWSEEQDETQKSFAHHQLKLHRSKATATKESISAIRELIRQAFRISVVKKCRFLFGNSIFMPTESYTLHIPHSTIIRKQQFDLTESRINQSLISLMACDELCAIFGSEMSTTNMFLELELQTDVAVPANGMGIFPKDVLSQLPRSCKNVHLHLLYDHGHQPAPELAIYQDLELMRLEQSTSQVEDSEVTDKSKEEQEFSWWQAEAIVRGFKTPNHKSFDLWSS